MSSTAAQALFEEGTRLKRSGDLPGALDAFRRSLKINPKVAASWIGLAEVMEANQQSVDALECLKRAVKVEPRSAFATTKLARAHQALGGLQEARHRYQDALGLLPNYTPALLGLARLNEEEGEPDAAAACYRQVLAEEPTNASALGSILMLGSGIDVSKEVKRARRLLKESDNESKALIGFGLGKTLDRMGRFDEAFEAFAIANASRRESSGAFSRERFDQRIDAMISLFSKRFFHERVCWGNQSDTPVLIVGLPRSGTTLTEQIISSHPQCFGAGELAVLTDLATGTPHRIGRPDPPWPFCATELSEYHVQAIGSEYIEHLVGRAQDNPLRIVDKQPLNFWHLGLVAVALPKARIIHCSRDIRDNALSIYSQNFSIDQRWATGLGDIAHYWKGYERLMRHWAKVTRLDFLNVRYEDTVSDLESQARRLLDFLKLDWNPNTLQFHKSTRAVQTPSKWQVRQPIYTASREKWRNYEKHLTSLLDSVDSSL